MLIFYNCKAIFSVKNVLSIVLKHRKRYSLPTLTINKLSVVINDFKARTI